MRRHPSVKAIVFISILLVLVILGVIFRKTRVPVVPEPPPDSVSRILVFQFTIRNTTPHPVFNSRFHVYAPVRDTDTQHCESLSASHPFEMSTDAVGHQLLTFIFETLPPYGSKSISIRAHLSMRQTPWTEAPGDPGPFATPDELFCDAKIRQVAGTLKKQTVQDTATAIYQWSRSHVRYSGYSREEKGACAALDQRQGDCTEFAALVVALCRAAGVPARRVSGFYAPDSVLNASDYHDWAEFFDDGKWRLVDAQRGVMDDQYPDYVVTRIAVDPPGRQGSHVLFHLFSIEGEGLVVKMV